MKRWYDKYLAAYNKPFGEVPEALRDEVKSRLEAMQSDTPIASVILIAHNEGRRIMSCLWSLSENLTQFPVEIFVVDNNSTDDTVQVVEALGVRCIRETKKGPGYARQCGLDNAKGRYYLAIDSDSFYPSRYVDTMIRTLERDGVMCCYGLWSFLPDAKHSRFGLWCYEWMRDCYLRLQNRKRPELCVRGMVMAFRTDEGRKVGFRTDIIRGEDGSMALGLKQVGKLQFLTSRKVRIITDNATMNKDGSFFDSFRLRTIKAIKNAGGIFLARSKYHDDDDNLIK